jgi:protein TonB
MRLQLLLCCLLAPLALSACGQAPADVPVAPPSQVMAVSTPPPAYPPEVACMGGEGTSVLKVVIGTDGRPQDIIVLTSSGHPALDQAARTAVTGWEFRPATRNGVASASTIQVPVTFRLPDELPADCFAVQERMRRGG